MRRAAVAVSAAMVLCGWATARGASLPDTGQTTCYDYATGGEAPCAGTGQDGEYALSLPSYTDNGDGTVTDNVTGLMWQRRDDGATHNWYRASGTFDATYNRESVSVCGALRAGGYTDWRLPAVHELVNIVDYSIPSPGPTIDGAFFPGTTSSSYWTSTSFVGYPIEAWVVDFTYGTVNAWHNKGTYAFPVRCVRGTLGGLARASGGSRFVDNGDGTVTDTVSGLTWQQGEGSTVTSSAAANYCRALAIGERRGFRAPTVKELFSIVDPTQRNPAFDRTAFPAAGSNFYWTSTAVPTTDRVQATYMMSSIDGSVGWDYFDTAYQVRCVSGGRVTVKVDAAFGLVLRVPVLIRANPPDVNDRSSGMTPFRLTYDVGTRVILSVASPTRGDYSWSWPASCQDNAYLDPRCIRTLTRDEDLTVQFSDSTGWRARESDLGGGWKSSTWFGTYSVSTDPWVYHAQHGFLYPFDEPGGGVFFWDVGQGAFWWTKSGTYPFLYRFNASPSWLWYAEGSAAPRVFFNWGTGAWENVP